MSELYTVFFNVNGEVADASFEFRENAIAFAKCLEGETFAPSGENPDPRVIDMFAGDEGEYVEIYPEESDDA